MIRAAPTSADAPHVAAVLHRLRQGQGAQDCRVHDGVPEEIYWRVVERLERAGKLGAVLEGRA